METPVAIWCWHRLVRSSHSSLCAASAERYLFTLTIKAPAPLFSSDHGNAGDWLGRMEQEVLRGQQDVPWLRRRGSKNSRKLLYFVEWFLECKMSDFFSLFCFLFLCSSESYHTLEATSFEDNQIPVDAWVAHGMFLVAHLRILLHQSPSANDRKKNKKHPNSFSDQQLATETDVRWTQSSRYNKQ